VDETGANDVVGHEQIASADLRFASVDFRFSFLQNAARLLGAYFFRPSISDRHFHAEHRKPDTFRKTASKPLLNRLTSQCLGVWLESGNIRIASGGRGRKKFFDADQCERIRQHAGMPARQSHEKNTQPRCGARLLNRPSSPT
jgi:hypothetical protein